MRILMLGNSLTFVNDMPRMQEELTGTEVGQRFYELSDAQNLYAADGVHPNEEGSRLAAEIIATVIQKQEEKQRLREGTR